MYVPELERMLRAAGVGGGGGPPRRTGWQQSGQLIVGGGQPVTCQYDFGEADTFTVSFINPYATYSGGNDIGVRAEALIMWNVSGAYKPVRVSVVGGMSVTATAQGVKIIMSDATPTSIPEYAPVDTAFNVSCQVARGTRGSSASPPYYQPISLASFITVPAAGPIEGVNIPTDAGIQSVYMAVVNADGTAVNPGDALASQLVKSALGSLAPAAIFNWDPVRTSGFWTPLAAGCTILHMQNVAGTKDQRWSVMFGVDG